MKQKKKDLSNSKKEKIYDHLVELVNNLNKKEYKHHDRDDLDYYGIRDIKHLFTNDDDDDDDDDGDDNYYEPVLVKISFKNNYKYYESRSEKDKKLSVKQYLYKIMPYLSDLINNHKAIRNESNEWKIQLNMSVNCYLF